MKNIMEIYSKPWDFTLYEVDGKKVLIVIFMDRIDYPRSFRLDEKQENLSKIEFERLATLIRENYCNYIASEIAPSHILVLVKQNIS